MTSQWLPCKYLICLIDRVCQSYPQMHIVPKQVTDEDLKMSASFRGGRRFPSVVWRYGLSSLWLFCYVYMQFFVIVALTTCWLAGWICEFSRNLLLLYCRQEELYVPFENSPSKVLIRAQGFRTKMDVEKCAMSAAVDAGATYQSFIKSLCKPVYSACNWHIKKF